jgi:hypothetical protein
VDYLYRMAPVTDGVSTPVRAESCAVSLHDGAAFNFGLIGPLLLTAGAENRKTHMLIFIVLLILLFGGLGFGGHYYGGYW